MVKVNIIRSGHRFECLPEYTWAQRAAKIQCTVQARTNQALAAHLCKDMKINFQVSSVACTLNYQIAFYSTTFPTTYLQINDQNLSINVQKKINEVEIKIVI